MELHGQERKKGMARGLVCGRDIDDREPISSVARSSDYLFEKCSAIGFSRICMAFYTRVVDFFFPFLLFSSREARRRKDEVTIFASSRLLVPRDRVCKCMYVRTPYCTSPYTSLDRLMK